MCILCRTEEYFEAFQNKDLDKLSELYSEFVVLNEWNENKFVGRENVLKANKELFESYNKITIKFIDKANNEDTSFNEIVVELENEDEYLEVDVLDVISLDPLGKIIEITAYRGF
jgi:ketosteroid isomerase-like protein